jgi:hypothetical protein
MSDIELNDDLQPILTEEKDYSKIDGQEEFHQWLRLETKRRLYGISARYSEDDIENKIELTIRRIARESDIINSVQNIKIERVYSAPEDQDSSGYRVNVRYNQSESINQILDSI